jgi:hypothetical protein
MLTSLIPPAIIGGLTLGGLAFRRFSLRNGRPATDAAILLALIAAAGALELGMGRPVKYARGPVRIWSGDITSDQNSQQIADPYTFTHFVHGAAFYGLAWTAMRPASVATRLVAATGVEAAWEVYENTDAVVERYRAETISLGYYGDSLVNSVADIAACIGGFLLAWRLPRAATIAWVATSELMLAFWIRDNLALNVLMLVYPLEGIRTWQAAILPIQ